jgi:hypothetical protein
MGDSVVAPDPNPYAPPAVEGKRPAPKYVASRPFRWRFIPAALFMILGLTAVVLGLVTAGLTIYFWLVEEAPPPLPELLVVCGFYLSVGAAWLTAGRLFWFRRYFAAVVAVLIGCLIPAVVFAVFRM